MAGEGCKSNDPVNVAPERNIVKVLECEIDIKEIESESFEC